MSGVEASLRIRVQDFRAWYPPFEQRSESLPPFAGTLTAACEYLIPQPVDALPEGAQLPDISGHRVVLVVAVDDLPKPCTDLARASMHPAAKLDLDGLELRNHPLLRRNTPDGEGIGLVAPPTVVGEAQEGERLWFSRATSYSHLMGSAFSPYGVPFSSHASTHILSFCGFTHNVRMAGLQKQRLRL